MKQIQKKISLEQFKSRMPSIIPAYYDKGKYYEFDGKQNFDSDSNRIPQTNYNMIPFSVKWGMGSYKINNSTPYSVISYNILSSWFHFIEFYIKLLTNNSDYCKKTYKNAIDYFNNEVNNDFIEEECLSFDEKIVEICGYSDNLYNTAMETYEYMINNFFPRFNILDEYKDYWHKDYLTLNEVYYWIHWLELTKTKLDSIDNSSECIDSYNCCDCDKFFKLGGNEMLKHLKSQLSNHFNLKKIDIGTLSINDINSWIVWFEEVKESISGITSDSNCDILPNCDDCKKYFKLGGDETLEYLKTLEDNIFSKFSEDGIIEIDKLRNLLTWFENIKLEIGDIEDQSECNGSDECNEFFNLGGDETLFNIKEFLNKYDSLFIYVEPKLNITIPLSLSIDDLGEFSILYEEWEGGVDYSYYDVNNIKGGAIVKYDSKDWVLNGRNPGYIYDNVYKEYYFTDEQYSRLIENNAIVKDESGDDKIKFEFNGFINYNPNYTYNFDGKKIFFNGITIEMLSSLYEKYQIIFNESFYVKGKIYEIIDVDYITYNGSDYIVYYDVEDNPIVKINGVNYYGIFNPIGQQTITINNINYSINTNEKGIIFNGKLYIVNNGKIKNESFYNKIHAYSIINGEFILFNDEMKIVYPQYNSILNEYELIENNFILGEKLSVIEENGELIFKINNEIINNIDNISKCYLVLNNYVNIVTPFTIYKTNEITGYTESKLSSFISSTNIIYDNIGNKLPGSYILSDDNEPKALKDNELIGLIYKPKTPIHLSNVYNDDGIQINNRYWCDYLETITLYYTDVNDNILTPKLNIDEDGSFEYIINSLNDILNGKFGKLKCDFVYYMGCVIDKNLENGDITLVDKGIMYVDNTELKIDKCKYFLNDYTCILLNYYNIVHSNINYVNETYNYNSSTKKSTFTFNVTNFMREDGSFKCNGWVDFPVFREEYKLGSSSLSMIDADVYVDRGTARSFDNHIKLLEVNSLESLEQYGNGYFNIISN